MGQLWIRFGRRNFDYYQATSQGSAGSEGVDLRHANAERLLESMRQFDSLKGQGLFRFIRFVDSLADAEIDLEPAGTFNGNAI